MNEMTGEVMRATLAAAESKKAPSGKQGLKTSEREFTVVDAFSTHFGQFAWVDGKLVVHVFPRAGENDKFYPPKYTENGKQYIPGRLEKNAGIKWRGDIRQIIENACNEVTFGDVELDWIPELHAWALRFHDCAVVDDWMGDGGYLAQFFTSIDAQLDS